MKRKHTQKNILIAFLIMAMLMMSVGYAALASQLDINGISGITGKFKVEFTSLNEGVAVGGATNKTPATYTSTTVNFDVELVSPGDSMTYEAVVKNTGNLDAKLDSIVGLPTSDENSAIIYTMSGVETGDILRSSESKTITIKVEYNSAIESQPEDSELSKSLSITLNYVQSIEGN